MNPVNKILGKGIKFDVGKNKTNSIEDNYGTLIYVNDYIVDENGNVGKVLKITGDTAIVDFGKKIGQDAVYSGERIKKGKKW